MTYTERNVDIQRLADAIEDFSKTNGFETKVYKDESSPATWFQLQSMKTGKGRTAVGARRCLDVVVRGQPDNFDVAICSGDWGKNITASLIVGTLTLGAGLLWAGASAVTYRLFEDKLWGYIQAQVSSLTETAAKPV
ncbi:MAG: hypothetical protein V3R93_03805 [Candidatus Hydrothermarchaeaceae archaeon]